MPLKCQRQLVFACATFGEEGREMVRLPLSQTKEDGFSLKNKRRMTLYETGILR